jgi:hypothetical protein
VLRVVADEVRLRGFCALPLAAVAARAGVCLTLARAAIRLAAGDGLLVIKERRRRGCPSLPNVLRILSREWEAWIAKWGRPPSLHFCKPHEDRGVKGMATAGGTACRSAPDRQRSQRKRLPMKATD